MMIIGAFCDSHDYCSYKALTMIFVQHLFTADYVPRTLLVTQKQHEYKKHEIVCVHKKKKICQSSQETMKS